MSHAEKLKLFKREGCPKCGSGVGNIILAYCEKARPIMKCWPYIDKEHLHHHCRICSYEWMTACREEKKLERLRRAARKNV